MAINVYENGREEKCVYKLTHAYIFITKIEMQKEAEDKDMARL